MHPADRFMYISFLVQFDGKCCTEICGNIPVAVDVNFLLLLLLTVSDVLKFLLFLSVI
jgi:hypothetical protein